MKFFISWQIAEVLRREKRARGYSWKDLQDRIAQISRQDEPSKSTLERMLKGDRWTKDKNFNLLLQALDLDRQQVLAQAEKIIDWKQMWQREFLKNSHLTVSHIISGDNFILKNPPLFEPALVPYSRPAQHAPETYSSPEKSSINPLKSLTLQKFRKTVLHRYLEGKADFPARLVFVGEGGIGKSTLLTKIGNLLFEYKDSSVNGEDRITVIRIRLADLKRSQTLEVYIFSSLLERVLRQHTASEDAKSQLTDLFKGGKVWLLLDGVDEVVHHSRDLLRLGQQLTGVLSQANIILTCRLNTWEHESNSLRDEFRSVYQLQKLDSGTGRNLGQVGKFINSCLPKPLAKDLISQLQDPKYAATRSLVTNPLLLTLLCYTAHRWQKQGGLPDTKAQIYQKFVEYLYEVKPQLAVFDGFKQNELNPSLGILAFHALDQSSSPYRLPRSFVLKVWQEANLRPKLLHLFERLSFLGRTGVAEENPDERVYVFLHSSLQAYFAARAVTDHRMLFNLNPSDPSGIVDRLLQLHWNEVYLFCMGGDWLDETQKEALLEDLIHPSNYCNAYYYHYGVCLAAQGIAEFKTSKLGDAIAQQLVDWSLEGWDSTESPRNYQSIAKSNMATRYLALSDSERVIEYLKYQLKLSQNNCDRSYQVASRLAELEAGKPAAITELVQLLQCDSEEVRDNSASLLSKLQPSHPVLKEYLENCLRSSKEPDQLFAIDLLQKMGRKIPDLVSMLVNLCETSQNNEIQKYAASLLFEVAPNHPYAAPQQKAEVIEDASDYSSIPIQQVLVWISLLESAKRHKDSDQLLLRFHSWLKDKQNLGKLLKNEEQTIRVICTLKRWLNLSDEHSFEFQLCNLSLYRCAQFIPYTIFCEGWNQ